MKINFRKKALLLTAILLLVSILDFNYLKAQTASQSTYPDTYNNLNSETKLFVNRLNQLPQSFIFNKNLKRGTPTSPDVQYLKWILNSDPRTALTDNPNMTLQELTSAFGPITEAAVKRFQTLYRSEILDPQKIANATGIVGNATKQKLNSLLTKSRLIANYSNVLNSALYARSTNTINNNPGFNSNTTNYSNSYTNTNSNNSVDFSYLNSLNLDTIFNNYSSISTSSTNYNTALIVVASSSDQARANASTTGNRSSHSNNNSNNGSNNSSMGGVMSPMTLIGVTALLSGDFVGSSITAYLNGNGTGITGATNLLKDAGSSLSGGMLSGSGGSSNGSGSSSGGAGGAMGLGAAGIAGGMAGGGGAGGGAAGGAGAATMLSQFGGKISMTKTCECSGNYMITLLDVGTKMSLSIMFQPGLSSLKMNYNPTMGQTVLGGYIRGAATCMIYVGTSCSSFGNPTGTIDTIRGIGTTLSPAGI